MAKVKLLRSSSGEASEDKTEQNYKETSWLNLQCSGSSQIPSQENLDNSHLFLSLYDVIWRENRTELIIYDTKNKEKEVKILDNESRLDWSTSITQLPNGELFCYNNHNYGTTVIIDRSYRVRELPSGTKCGYSSALYFNNHIYCFGGYYNGNYVALSRKFDLKNNRWINLAKLPNDDYCCHSVIFNRNIFVSGYYSINLWIYSIDIDSFSIISYNFACSKRKFLINVERLYLIEWGYDGLIYESEDGYHWKPISKSGLLDDDWRQMYCLYNKEKIYISSGYQYYQFDLKKSVLLELNKP